MNGAADGQVDRLTGERVGRWAVERVTEVTAGLVRVGRRSSLVITAPEIRC